MPLQTHGEEKFQTCDLLSGPLEWEALRIEHRQVESGRQGSVTPQCTEFVHILSGATRVKRTGDGQTQEGIARPGTSWLVPAGTHETFVELDGSAEILVVYLPASLLAHSALADYELNPDRIQLAYAGGASDPLLSHIGTSLRGLLDREARPTDRILADGLRTTLAGHLIGNYAVDLWKPPTRAPSLDAKRLKRVLDFIEAHLASDLSLNDLADKACLSPFHFSRLFRKAIGLPPWRYVTDRRIRAAQKMLALDQSSLVQIALDTGFGSQANFTRAFRKASGMTPGQYRALGLR